MSKLAVGIVTHTSMTHFDLIAVQRRLVMYIIEGSTM